MKCLALAICLGLGAALPVRADDVSMQLGFDAGLEVNDDPAGAAAVLLSGGRPLPGVRSGAVAIGAPGVQYEGGTPAQRSARIVADPLRPDNRVLAFEVREPNVRQGAQRKSRVQMNLYGNEGVREAYVSVRMLLGPDLARLETYGRRIDWLTLSEWWNGAPWTGDATPFRITVGLHRAAGTGAVPLRFAVEAQAMAPGRKDFRDSTVWSVTDERGDVPLGHWLKVEYYFLEGDADHGRFAMAVTPEGGTRRVVADFRGPTRHPGALGAGPGLRHLNPIKLYTSADVTEHVRAGGGVLRVLWDDLTVQFCGPVVAPGGSVCRQRWQAG